MSTSQNGWMVLTSRATGALPRLRRWTVPGTGIVIPLRDGCAGFVLIHMLLWWHERIEPITGPIPDDWGWASRPIRGQDTGYSNHASGTAIDINATRHVLGRRPLASLPGRSVRRIRRRLGHARYRAVLRWGGDYNGRKDTMHIELVAPLRVVNTVALALLKTKRGRRIAKANPGSAAAVRA